MRVFFVFPLSLLVEEIFLLFLFSVLTVLSEDLIAEQREIIAFFLRVPFDLSPKDEVPHCSATGDSVAATPPFTVTSSKRQLQMRHPIPALKM